MPLSQSAESQRRLRIQKPPGTKQLVKWSILTPLLQTLFRQIGYQLQIDGAESLRTDSNGGIQAKIVPSTTTPAVVNTHNWTPTKVDATHLTISASSAAGGYPTIGGTSIAAGTPPQLTVSSSALVYVYLKVTFSLTIDASGYVTGSSVSSRVITAESTTKTSSGTDRYFLLFTWQAGAIVTQTTFWNFDMDVKDDGTATSTAVYRAWISA
ncbi:hypothetical protein [Prosthecobacter sp.]|uniref:hypothetical protein n=1 Tax=Prosthecobacter sp. TaxID=1965333 RepID=UPI0037853179